METSLSRQLQQAWLESQMRKQKSNLESSPTSTSDSHTRLSSPSLPSSSGSSISSDPCPEASSTSTQDLHEEAFRDPVLQYINDMLMDEDLEDRKCMMQECMSYFATAKGFYDLLGNGEVLSLPRRDGHEQVRVDGQGPYDSLNGSACIGGILPQENHFMPNGGVHKDEVQDGVSALSGEHLRVSLDDPIATTNSVVMEGPVKVSRMEDNLASVPAHVDEGPYQGSNDEYDWIDDVLNSLSAPSPSQQDVPAGLVLLPTTLHPSFSDSTGSSNFVIQGTSQASQGTIESTAQCNGVSVLYPSLQGGSVLTNPASPSFQSRGFPVGAINGQQRSDRGAGRSDLSWVDGSIGSELFKRSASDSLTSKVPSAISSSSSSIISSRLKRTASQADQVTDESESSNVTGDWIEEETLSFVQNKNLNAEKYGRFLNEGLGSIAGKLCKSPVASSQGNIGKGTLKVATTADLKGLLVSCAQAVASSNMHRAHEILQEIRQDASPYGSGLQRLAHYFAEGLVARLSGTGGRLYTVFTSNMPSAAKLLKAHHLFVDVCPFVKVSHYFANRAIVEAARGASRLHVIDYGILYGLQWPSLISALAERKGGPPVLRITGIELPQPGSSHAERVEMTGKRLAEYAKTYGVPFEYHPVASRWEVVQVSSLHLREDEVVIVNSMHRLHHLLDETVLASNPRKTVLSRIAEINPKLFVLGIKNGNYNAPFFMSRFKEALAFFSGLFDLLESTIQSDNQERIMIEREVLGRDILNVVACEGPERVERPETYRQWQNRIVRAGLGAIPLDKVVVKEAQMFTRSKYNKNFGVDEDGSWMLLSWKGKVVHGLSLWKPKRSGHS